MKGGAARLEAALIHNHIAHDLQEYPAVGHGFLNQHGGVSGWIMTRLGMKFDAAAADAQARITAFFGQHLH